MRTVAIATVLLIGATLPVYGQGFEMGLTVGWSSFTDNAIGLEEAFGEEPAEYSIDNGLRIGGRMGVNFGNFLGHEGTYSWQRSNLEILDQSFGSFSIHNLYYNLLLHATPEGSVIRPFVTGGGGVSVFNPPGFSSFSGAGDNKFGYNYGAGVKIKMTEIYGIRLDVRDYVTGKPFDLPGGDGRLHNIEFSAGFSLLF